MKFEVEVKLVNGFVKSFITKDYEAYNPQYKSVNGLYQVGFIKEGKLDIHGHQLNQKHIHITLK